MTDFKALRVRMVREHIHARGVTDKRVLRAMSTVPREAFIRPDLAGFAYDDMPLPTSLNQTISQPFIVAEMIEAAGVRPDDRVLEVGAGSGYAAAVIACIAREVFAVERYEDLVSSARKRLRDLGYKNVEVVHGDGSLGLPDRAPFDAIIVSAGGPSIPEHLRNQLSIGGRLIIPIGRTPRAQELIRVVRHSTEEYLVENLGPVRFVPLIGAHGWPEGHEGPDNGSARPA